MISASGPLHLCQGRVCSSRELHSWDHGHQGPIYRVATALAFLKLVIFAFYNIGWQWGLHIGLHEATIFWKHSQFRPLLEMFLIFLQAPTGETGGRTDRQTALCYVAFQLERRFATEQRTTFIVNDVTCRRDVIAGSGRRKWMMARPRGHL